MIVHLNRNIIIEITEEIHVEITKDITKDILNLNNLRTSIKNI